MFFCVFFFLNCKTEVAIHEIVKHGNKNINWVGQFGPCEPVLHWQLEKPLEVGVSVTPRT